MEELKDKIVELQKRIEFIEARLEGLDTLEERINYIEQSLKEILQDVELLRIELQNIKQIKDCRTLVVPRPGFEPGTCGSTVRRHSQARLPRDPTAQPSITTHLEVVYKSFCDAQTTER